VGFAAMGGATPQLLAIPLHKGAMFPALKPFGLDSPADFKGASGVLQFERSGIAPGPDPETYAFTQTNVHRNLYRVPLPD
jgi:hypothetical protein